MTETVVPRMMATTAETARTIGQVLWPSSTQAAHALIVYKKVCHKSTPEGKFRRGTTSVSRIVQSYFWDSRGVAEVGTFTENMALKSADQGTVRLLFAAVARAAPARRLEALVKIV